MEEYVIFLMSDHHFYSTITAMSYEKNSNVLQHGLIMDKRFYYPIRAGRFFAWGLKSKMILENDDKVVVTGTYKFDDLKQNETAIDKKVDILFCIGSLDTAIVKRKIDILIGITKKYGMKLYVKCHPGSLFDLNVWEETYKGAGIQFFKESRLEEIKFDLAVSENSTVIMDLIALGKPFILFDSLDGYFGEYFKVIPHGNSMEELAACFQVCDHVDYKKIKEVLQQNELNGNKCEILEKIYLDETGVK